MSRLVSLSRIEPFRKGSDFRVRGVVVLPTGRSQVGDGWDGNYQVLTCVSWDGVGDGHTYGEGCGPYRDAEGDVDLTGLVVFPVRTFARGKRCW